MIKIRYFAEQIINLLVLMLVLLVEPLIRRSARDGNPAYFDTERFPFTKLLEEQYSVIRSELDAVLTDRESIPGFQEVSKEQYRLTDDDKWKTFFFYVFGTPILKNCAQCPETAQLLKKLPGLNNAMFSILAPHKSIPLHRGPYNGLIRYHLALKVPRDRENCFIEVNGEQRNWTEGQTLLLDDTYPHRVENNTQDERVVLFADFERPTAGLTKWINKVMIWLISQTPFSRNPVKFFEKQNEPQTEP